MPTGANPEGNEWIDNVTYPAESGFDIYINGDQVNEITVDGANVTEATIDGNVI